MKQLEQLELPLWDVLREATLAPDEADLRQLLHVLDDVLSHLDTVGQLQVAAEAIAQIAQVFQDRSMLAFEDLEATNSNDGPVMSADAFDRYVRQTMEVDFEQFIEPIASLPRKASQHLAEEACSVVGALDQAALLQVLDQQMSEAPQLTEAEIFNRTLAVAHAEDISKWVEAIAQHFNTARQAIRLVELQQAVNLPLIATWLGLLLSGYSLEQQGSFYDLQTIWVTGFPSSPTFHQENSNI